MRFSLTPLRLAAVIVTLAAAAINPRSAAAALPPLGDCDETAFCQAGDDANYYCWNEYPPVFSYYAVCWDQNPFFVECDDEDSSHLINAGGWGCAGYNIADIGYNYQLCPNAYCS